jgi:hypothetical protein
MMIPKSNGVGGQHHASQSCSGSGHDRCRGSDRDFAGAIAAAGQRLSRARRCRDVGHRAARYDCQSAWSARACRLVDAAFVRAGSETGGLGDDELPCHRGIHLGYRSHQTITGLIAANSASAETATQIAAANPSRTCIGRPSATQQFKFALTLWPVMSAGRGKAIQPAHHGSSGVRRSLAFAAFPALIVHSVWRKRADW